jgi:hypothetical protein
MGEAAALCGRKGNIISAARAHATVERLGHSAHIVDAV